VRANSVPPRTHSCDKGRVRGRNKARYMYGENKEEVRENEGRLTGGGNCMEEG